MDVEIIKSVQKYAKVSQEALATFCPDFLHVRLVTKVDFSFNRTSHRGGWYSGGPGINMAARFFVEWKTVCKPSILAVVNEYAKLAPDPVIGSAYITHWEQLVAVTTGHEVAHACQRWKEISGRMPRSLPHGKEFQDIYRVIRNRINQELPNQVKTKREYNDFLLSIKKREKNAII